MMQLNHLAWKESLVYHGGIPDPHPMPPETTPIRVSLLSFDGSKVLTGPPLSPLQDALFLFVVPILSPLVQNRPRPLIPFGRDSLTPSLVLAFRDALYFNCFVQSSLEMTVTLTSSSLPRSDFSVKPYPCTVATVPAQKSSLWPLYWSRHIGVSPY